MKAIKATRRLPVVGVGGPLADRGEEERRAGPDELSFRVFGEPELAIKISLYATGVKNGQNRENGKASRSINLMSIH